MKFRCSSCKNCPYCYNGEYCKLASEYIEDMNYCPDYGEFEEESDYFYDDNGEKVYYDDLKVVNKW